MKQVAYLPFQQHRDTEDRLRSLATQPDRSGNFIVWL